MFSKKCSYGIRAVVYMATLKQENEFISIFKIAEKLNISFHFLTKILQTLTKQNIITSYRGPKGGVAFARPIDSITLFEIVQSIDGEKLFDDCILGLANCSDHNPCPLHKQASLAKTQLKTILQTTTVYELAHQVKDLNLRLAE